MEGCSFSATFVQKNSTKHTMPESVGSVIGKFCDEYINSTPKKLKIVDAYLLYIMLTGIIQFLYCCLVGTFPFNSFLSGFISTVASFVLGVCLRVQDKHLSLTTHLTHHGNNGTDW
ncbi:unnamed protein product [Owenia fusiformis]|uniref:Dolichyl-diphosphooligosaccharide--protein glycosyltransferase subunit DAD1 n=1 Tax=Owenia fusiformis TaxID=6347 RepID=A0A8S4ND30_OWEFU|nr:unnamed protein product [Owenia fusiformis]